jgi:hypothetical protein
MVIWWNDPRPPCFIGMVRKKVFPSLENNGSSFCKKKECSQLVMTRKNRQIFWFCKVFPLYPSPVKSIAQEIIE